MFEDDGLCVIEWPQFIEDIIPEERLEIEIIKNEGETRSLKCFIHTVKNMRTM